MRGTAGRKAKARREPRKEERAMASGVSATTGDATTVAATDETKAETQKIGAETDVAVEGMTEQTHG